MGKLRWTGVDCPSVSIGVAITAPIISSGLRDLGNDGKATEVEGGLLLKCLYCPISHVQPTTNSCLEFPTVSAPIIVHS